MRQKGDSTSALVFAYGTLRRGEPAHHLVADTAFVTLARTLPRYTMVSMGEYPALLEGGTCAILGEVYRVDLERLTILDAYEEVPDFYRRVTVEVADLAAPGPLWAELYVLPARHALDAPAIPSGDWRRR